MTVRTRFGRAAAALALAVLAAIAVLATAACTPEEPAGKTLLYGFPMLPPEPDAGPDAAKKAAEAAEALARRTEEILAARMKSMGWTGVTVTTSGARGLRVHVPAALEPEIPFVRALVERTGSLEFRLRAPPAVENACRPMQPQDYPAGLRRVPRTDADESSGPQFVVVEAPEELPLDPARPLQDDIFVAEDLASLEAVAEGSDNVLVFEMRPERKAAFTEFTKRNVERSVAILIDGTVVSAPVIKSPLPGSGKIARDGEGFSRRDAQTLAALLGHGRLPCRLEFIAQE